MYLYNIAARGHLCQKNLLDLARLSRIPELRLKIIRKRRTCRQIQPFARAFEATLAELRKLRNGPESHFGPLGSKSFEIARNTAPMHKSGAPRFENTAPVHKSDIPRLSLASKSFENIAPTHKSKLRVLLTRGSKV